MRAHVLLLHGIISLPDVTSCDKIYMYFMYLVWLSLKLSWLIWVLLGCKIKDGFSCDVAQSDNRIRIIHRWVWGIITIHHERPCRIEISHPRGRKFNQGRGLPSPWLNSDPEGEISLSYMDRLMMDRFSPTFEAFLSEHKNSMKTWIF